MSILFLLNHWYLWFLEVNFSPFIVHKAVAVQVALMGKTFSTLITLKAFLIVDIAVAAQVCFMGEALATDVTGILLFLLVNKFMNVEVVLMNEPLATNIALVLLVFITHVLVVIDIISHDLLILCLLPTVSEPVAVQVNLLPKPLSTLLTLKCLIL